MKAKRILSLVLALCMVMTLFAVVPVSAAVSADAINEAVILDLDFSDYNGEDTWTDETGNLTVDTSAFEKGEGKNGASALKVDNNGTLRWHSDVFDPFAQCAEGITMVLWLKTDAKADYTHFFNYKKSPNRGIVLQANSGNGAYLFRMNNQPNGNWDNINDNNKYPGNGNWMMLTVTQDATGQAYLYINGEETSAKKFDANVTPYLISQSGDEVAQYNILGPTGPGYDQWSGDKAYSGVCQQATIYDRALTASEVLYLYDPTAGADQAKVNNVKTLIETAKAATAGSAEQATAYKAAVAAYDELNTLEKEEITNYADLAAVKAAWIEATGVILGFDFNGNYEEALGRVSFKNTNHTTITDTAAEFDGADIGWWTKTMGFEHRSYPFFDQTAGDLTIEQIVKADAYNSNNALFGLTWGENQYIKVMGLANGVLRLNFKQEGQSSITINSDEGALEAGVWQTISLVQKKADDATSTVIYVDGKPAITTTEIMALADLSITHDDLFAIGATDHDAHNVFDGLMDSFYVYNFAKEFAADYSAVEEAIDAVPEDLDVAYTEETAQAVKDAVAAVVYDLGAGEQAAVDGYAKAINDAIAALKLKTLDLSLTISDAVVVAGDEDAYNITWNANVVLGEGVSFDDINNSGATFTEYGVIYGTSEDAVLAKIDGVETTSAKIKAFAEGDDIDVYTIFGFRLKNVGEGKERAAMFYVTYEMNGHTITVYSPMATGETIA